MNSVFSGHITEIFLVPLRYRDLQNESIVLLNANTGKYKPGKTGKCNPNWDDFQAVSVLLILNKMIF